MSKETREAVWHVLVGPLRAQRRRLGVVILLASLSAGASLVEPLIYRAAIDDIAGLFVHRAYEKAGAPATAAASTANAHSHGKVAARTTDQAFRTLIWAVVLLSLTTAA